MGKAGARKGVWGLIEQLVAGHTSSVLCAHKTHRSYVLTYRDPNDEADETGYFISRPSRREASF
jgi:hypothetical protein